MCEQAKQQCPWRTRWAQLRQKSECSGGEQGANASSWLWLWLLPLGARISTLTHRRGGLLQQHCTALRCQDAVSGRDHQPWIVLASYNISHAPFEDCNAQAQTRYGPFGLSERWKQQLCPGLVVSRSRRTRLLARELRRLLQGYRRCRFPTRASADLCCPPALSQISVVSVQQLVRRSLAHLVSPSTGLHLRHRFLPPRIQQQQRDLP